MPIDMAIELYGGPADGMIIAVPESARNVVVPTPTMTPAEFIALENGGPMASAVYPQLEHEYVYTSQFSRRSHARFFRYSGPRRLASK